MCFTVKVMQPKLHLTLVGNDRGWSCCDVYTRVDEGRGDSLLAIFATCYMRYNYSE